MTDVKLDFDKLNKDIELFPNVHPVEKGMNITFEGVSRLIMLDRYSYKDLERKTLRVGDLVLLTVKDDPKFPARGIGYVESLDGDSVVVKVDEEYVDTAGVERLEVVKNDVDKPLELFYEQIAKRVARGVSEIEIEDDLQEESFKEFYREISELNVVPAGRVLFGAGSGTDVTYFNCFTLPFVHDSRGGISDHRKTVMEIMSRGGGVGTNGSTLRPKGALAKGVNGKSSGAVGWLDDIAKLTHLVEQGGSRRGAQMIMMFDWHPDIVEFIVSKVQNPRILRYILDNIDNDIIRREVKNKLVFTPLNDSDRKLYENIVSNKHLFDKEVVEEASEKLKDGGVYSVENPEFLTGANISVGITDDFMKALENDELYELRFPDIENYSVEEMVDYNEQWHEVGDVREWERMGYGIKTYHKVPARDLWNLINICATYSAEPGVFFIDRANKMTNAQAYGQKVVVTNPCGGVRLK